MMKIVKNTCVMSIAMASTLFAFTAFAQAPAPKAAPAPAPAPAATPAPKAAPVAKKAVQVQKKDDKKTLPLAEARAQISAVIADAAKMTEIMKQLSVEDQKTFTADVNAAIAKLPGSTEDKTAKYLNLNKAAIKGASEGNAANVLAVTFATVPPESLTVISETFANDLFNRDADPSHTYSDAQFQKTAVEVCGKIEQATAGSDDAGVRNTLGILMFLRASNGQEGLVDVLVETLPDSATKELAKKEWIPAATAEGENKSYEGMLSYADAGNPPNIEMVISLAGPQILDAMLVDITSGMDNSAQVQTTPVLDQAFGGFDEARIYSHEDTKSATSEQNNGGTVPKTTDPTAPWNPGYNRDNVDEIKETEPEPEPYPYGNLGK